MWRRSLVASARAWPHRTVVVSIEQQSAAVVAGRPLLFASNNHSYDTTTIQQQQRRFLGTRGRSIGEQSADNPHDKQSTDKERDEDKGNVENANTFSSTATNAPEAVVDVTKIATAPVLNPRTTEWIPPNRELVGDRGESYLYANQQLDDDDDDDDELSDEDEDDPLLVLPNKKLTEAEELHLVEQALAKLERKEAKERQLQEERRRLAQQAQQQPDWLQLRREKLGQTVVDGQLTPSYTRPGQDLPVVHHTLLKAEEIMTYLEGLGGMDIKLVKDYPVGPYGDSRMGGIMKGMIFATASSNAHLTLLADSLAEQLKNRRLHECGVDAALLGPEGSRDPDETWMVVDCYNYLVHIQDERTRRYLKLEELWSSPHPLADADPNDEQAEEDYLDANPIPDGYGRAGAVDWTETINKLENRRLTAPHKAVVKRPMRRWEKGRRKKANNWR